MSEKMKARIMKWFAHGERGRSSEALARHFAGMGPDRDGWEKWAHPHDPADLNRCIKFLDAVPGTRERIGEMARKSKQWAALVKIWPELEAMFRAEIRGQGEYWKARDTYNRMRAVLDPLDFSEPGVKRAGSNLTIRVSE